MQRHHLGWRSQHSPSHPSVAPTQTHRRSPRYCNLHAKAQSGPGSGVGGRSLPSHPLNAPLHCQPRRGRTPPASQLQSTQPLLLRPLLGADGQNGTQTFPTDAISHHPGQSHRVELGRERLGRAGTKRQGAGSQEPIRGRWASGMQDCT